MSVGRVQVAASLYAVSEDKLIKTLASVGFALNRTHGWWPYFRSVEIPVFNLPDEIIMLHW